MAIRVSRRALGSAAAALPLVPLLPRPAQAQDGAAAETVMQPPAFYRFDVGALALTVFSDGNLNLEPGVLAQNAPKGAIEDLLRANYLPIDNVLTQTNPVLVETGGRRVLVDVGSGDGFQPTAGRLVANMAAAGATPETIDTVVITHAHPDHCWGILNPDGAVRYPNAEFVVSEVEWNWWTKAGRAGEVPEAMRGTVEESQRQLAAIEARVRLIKDNAKVAPGLTAMIAPGHTPGHTTLLVEDGDARLLLSADCFTHPVASLAHPEWHFGFDMDAEQAVATRRRVLDMAATDRIPVLGYHMPWPGAGHVGRDGEGYRWYPENIDWG